MTVGCLGVKGLIAHATQPLHEESRSHFQTINTLSRNIQNCRWTSLGCPVFPACHIGYEIPDLFKYLPDGSSFLAVDNGIDDVH